VSGGYRVPVDHFDEAYLPDGSPRPLYSPLLAALEERDLEGLRRQAEAEAERLGLSFGEEGGMAIDPVPRLIDGEEWEALERGLRQRARALNAFVLDAYGDRRIVSAGVVPGHVLETTAGYEPAMRGLLDPAVPPAAVIGFDLVRDPSGAFLVLEDNLRMPSGASYAGAMRELSRPLIDSLDAPRPLEGYAQKLAQALGSRGDRDEEPTAAILSAGPGSGAWFEHEDLSRRTGVPIAVLDELETVDGRLHHSIEEGRRPLDVVYRRLDEERLTDAGGDPTPVGEALLPALKAGTLRCANAFGTAVADDKLAHVYVERMVDFYLGERPMLRSVPGFDLCDEDVRREVLPRLEELVVKPRDGFGGHGVTLMPRVAREVRERTREAVEREPGRFVAQEILPLSTHPTVCDGGLRPRHVDLRPFVVVGPDQEPEVMSGGLTRFAPGDGDMVVNSSRGGGCKDTWVMDR
jgi:uncharacterized circularly permuted ATP-grasp superfamily protein